MPEDNIDAIPVALETTDPKSFDSLVHEYITYCKLNKKDAIICARRELRHKAEFFLASDKEVKKLNSKAVKTTNSPSIRIQKFKEKTYQQRIHKTPHPHVIHPEEKSVWGEIFHLY